MINEAVFALQENVGTPEAIDAVMKLGMNHPMGYPTPLTLASDELDKPDYSTRKTRAGVSS
jgi:3-hydroxyacyl-CoA dehydrogenase